MKEKTSIGKKEDDKMNTIEAKRNIWTHLENKLQVYRIFHFMRRKQ